MDKREENLLRLKQMVEEKSKKFWSEYMDEESMPNDLLDIAIDLIHYQEGLIKNLEAKIKILDRTCGNCKYDVFDINPYE